MTTPTGLSDRGYRNGTAGILNFQEWGTVRVGSEKVVELSDSIRSERAEPTWQGRVDPCLADREELGARTLRGTSNERRLTRNESYRRASRSRRLGTGDSREAGQCNAKHLAHPRPPGETAT